MLLRPEGHPNIGEGHRDLQEVRRGRRRLERLHLRRQYCLAFKDPIKSILICCNNSHLCHLGNLHLQGITTTKMTMRNRFVKVEKINLEETDSTVIYREEITEAVMGSVEARPEAGHVTEEEDPVLDLERENPVIIGKDLDHVIVKKDKDLDQEKAGNPIMFGDRDLQGETGETGTGSDQDQLNVIETVGIEPRTVRRKVEMYHPTTQS